MVIVSFHELPLSFSLGAIHFFQKMNVGPLKIGDYLGMFTYDLV